MKQPLRFHEVNAFADGKANATGNPAMICIVDEFPDDAVMERAAAGLRAPMTSFLRRTDDPHIFDIRHFSPDGKENHVCGHATLAAAELLALQDHGLRKGARLTFRLNPKYAINADNAFYVAVSGDDIAMTMPAVTELQRVEDPYFYALLAAALNVRESDIVKPAYYAPRIINYVVEMKDQKTLLGLKPDFEALKRIAGGARFPHEGIMATAKSELKGYDIMTRVFMPIIDVDEDIACGSANCSVIPYWVMKRSEAFGNGRNEFTGLFPYPPRMHANETGGVQYLKFDPKREEVTLIGKAAWRRSFLFNPANDNKPKPGGP